MGDLSYTYSLEWAGTIAVNTWLHLSVEAEDDAALDRVSVLLVDTNTTKTGLPKGNDAYRAT